MNYLKSFTFLKSFLAAILLLNLFPSVSTAQYFGRNKVQYKSFDFKTLKTEHFNIFYYPKEREAVYDAGQMLERWQNRFAKLFGQNVGNDQPVILYASHAEFEQTNVIEGFLSEGTGGVTEALANRIVIPFTDNYKDNDHVLGHELVHAFQYNVIRSIPRGMASAGQLPLWFIEGMAEYLSIGRKDPLTSMWMRDAVLNNDVPSIDDISKNSKYFPYRYGEVLWAYIGSKWGDPMVTQLFTRSISRGWENSADTLLGIKVDTLSKEWQQAIRETYSPVLTGRSRPSEVGGRVIEEKDVMNLSPVLSPDGKYLAIISSHDLFTLDLYLVEAATGKFIKKLVSTNTDSHFDALRFMNSAGSWSPDGKRFAFVVVRKGDNEIAITDVSSGDIINTIEIRDVDEIENLDWSPDGSKIAFSATSGGINNLYFYDFSTKSTSQLTKDKYADIMPSWSPDGKTIAFATDRGAGTNFDKLTFGAPKIGLLDVASGKIDLISISDNAKHINPLYSPDGKSIYFISNPDGISDIYRYSLESREFYRVTKIATGISGLTELSPAMSIAKSTGRLAFNVFDKQQYNVRALEAGTALGGVYNKSENVAYILNISMPIVKNRDEGIVSKYLSSPEEGLPSGANFSSRDYKPSLRLVYAGQAGLGVSVDSYGSGLGGGISLLLSDLLANHLLAIEVQASGSLIDIGGQVTYLNVKNRLNWGGAIGHIPYLTGQFFYSYDTVTANGQTYYADKVSLLRQRIFNDNLMAMAIYPLSANRRFELNAGYSRISFSNEIETMTTLGGNILNDQTSSLNAPGALNMFQSSLAYVGDYSFFGFTSPIAGSRYRLEFESTLGSLQYFGFLADYRKYFLLSPVTFAFRALHYGRYGKDAENLYLSQLTLGYDSWIRGYNFDSFDLTECTDRGPNGECREINRLIGSKMAVVNAEMRIPLFGTSQFGLINFPYFPTELAFFFDGGVAWTENEAPVIKFVKTSAQRIPVFSTGVSARVNLFGYIIGEVFYVYPFQRPGKGAFFGFNIAPGW